MYDSENVLSLYHRDAKGITLAWKYLRPRWIVASHQSGTPQRYRHACVWVKQVKAVLGQIRAFGKHFCVDKVVYIEVKRIKLFLIIQHTGLYNHYANGPGFYQMANVLFQVQTRTGPKSAKIMGDCQRGQSMTGGAVSKRLES